MGIDYQVYGKLSIHDRPCYIYQKGDRLMNLGAIIALLKLAQDAEITKPAFKSIVVRPTYAKETALTRAEEGLGL